MGDRHLTFGQLFKAKRISLGMGLRKFCSVNGLDPGNVSKIERSVLQPPQREALKRYLGCLGIEEGSEEWYNFTDQAALEAGQIPRDILSREEAIKHLPVLFRTLRGGKPTKEDFERLVEIIRRY